MRAIVAAALAAILAQPFVFALRLIPALFAHAASPLNGIGLIFAAVLVVATVFVVVLGIPVFLLLKRYNRANWASLSLAGFLTSTIPIALIGWPRHLAGYSSGYSWHGHYEAFYVNGVPTIYAWLSYVEDTLFYGLHGLVGATVFYAVWRRTHVSRAHAHRKDFSAT